MDCPFRLCTSWVIPLVEQRQADDDELTVSRIPMHELTGVREYRAQCPASLMVVPVTAALGRLLEIQAEGIERIVASYQERGPEHRTNSDSDTPGHGRTPHPDADPRWFRGHQGENPRKEFTAGYKVVRPPLQYNVPQEGHSAVTGSHAEAANNLIAVAKEKIDEIRGSIAQATGQLEEVVRIVQTFQEKGQAVVGAIIQAAENSQNQGFQIQDAMATVHYATNDEASGVISTAQNNMAELQEMYNKLSAAHEMLEHTIF